MFRRVTHWVSRKYKSLTKLNGNGKRPRDDREDQESPQHRPIQFNIAPGNYDLNISPESSEPGASSEQPGNVSLTKKPEKAQIESSSQENVITRSRSTASSAASSTTSSTDSSSPEPTPESTPPSEQPTKRRRVSPDPSTSTKSSTRQDIQRSKPPAQRSARNNIHRSRSSARREAGKTVTHFGVTIPAVQRNIQRDWEEKTRFSNLLRDIEHQNTVLKTKYPSPSRAEPQWRDIHPEHSWGRASRKSTPNTTPSPPANPKPAEKPVARQEHTSPTVQLEATEFQKEEPKKDVEPTVASAAPAEAPVQDSAEAQVATPVSNPASTAVSAPVSAPAPPAAPSVAAGMSEQERSVMQTMCTRIAEMEKELQTHRQYAGEMSSAAAQYINRLESESQQVVQEIKAQKQYHGEFAAAAAQRIQCLENALLQVAHGVQHVHQETSQNSQHIQELGQGWLMHGQVLHEMLTRGPMVAQEETVQQPQLQQHPQMEPQQQRLAIEMAQQPHIQQQQQKLAIEPSRECEYSAEMEFEMTGRPVEQQQQQQQQQPPHPSSQQQQQNPFLKDKSLAGAQNAIPAPAQRPQIQSPQPPNPFMMGKVLNTAPAPNTSTRATYNPINSGDSSDSDEENPSAIQRQLAEANKRKAIYNLEAAQAAAAANKFNQYPHQQHYQAPPNSSHRRRSDSPNLFPENDNDNNSRVIPQQSIADRIRSNLQALRANNSGLYATNVAPAAAAAAAPTAPSSYRPPSQPRGGASSHQSKSSDMCKNMLKNGDCRFGAGCRFRHDVSAEDSGPAGGAVAAGKSKKPCRDWQSTGSCRFGAKCRYSHRGFGPAVEEQRVEKVKTMDEDDDDILFVD